MVQKGEVSLRDDQRSPRPYTTEAMSQMMAMRRNVAAIGSRSNMLEPRHFDSLGAYAGSWMDALCRVEAEQAFVNEPTSSDIVGRRGEQRHQNVLSSKVCCGAGREVIALGGG